MKRLRLAALAAIVLMGTGMVATAAAAPPHSIVIPPQQESYGQLGVLWWKWALSIPFQQNPIFDTSGMDCAVGQNGARWFLAGTPGGPPPGMPPGTPYTRSCTIPAGKAIFFPVISVEEDYPCPPSFNFEPAPGQSLKDFLTETAVTTIDQVTGPNANLDGQNISILPSYRGTSNMFSFAGDPSLTTTFDPCITGSQQKAVSDGYWLLLAPLSAGHHVLQFGGSSGGNPVQVTYDLTVR